VRSLNIKTGCLSRRVHLGIELEVDILRLDTEDESADI